MTEEALINSINDWDKRLVRRLNEEINKGNISGERVTHSHIEYVPEPPLRIGPLPKYIPSKIRQIEEPKYPFGPAERIKQNRLDPFHRVKRQINLVESELSVAEGDDRERLQKILQAHKESLDKIKKEKNKKRKDKKKAARRQEWESENTK